MYRSAYPRSYTSCGALWRAAIGLLPELVPGVVSACMGRRAAQEGRLGRWRLLGGYVLGHELGHVAVQSVVQVAVAQEMEPRIHVLQQLLHPGVAMTGSEA